MKEPLSSRVLSHHARTGGATWQTAKRFRLPRREVKVLIGAALRIGAGFNSAPNARRVIATFDMKWEGR